MATNKAGTLLLHRWALLVTLLVLVGCHDTGGPLIAQDSSLDDLDTSQQDETENVEVDTDVDAVEGVDSLDDSVGADLPVDVGDAVDVGGDPTGRPPFPVGLPPAELLGEPHGYQLARAVIHLHSIFSHDACDNLPVLEDDEPNLPCVENLRTALCVDQVDFALMSEHYDRMVTIQDFDELFLHWQGDLWMDEGGIHSASAIPCDDGHRALIMPGLEGGSNDVSPLGLKAHPVVGTPEEVESAYHDESPEGLQRLRDAGAVLSAIHIESSEPAWLEAIDVDTFEISNLHVLIAPNYRSLLGLDPGTPGIAFARYILHPEENPPGDLVFLEFHERLDLTLDLWDSVLEQRLVPGFLGNDAHQNVLDIPMGDGDRPDSYRRMFKWACNHLLVTEVTPSQAREALASGRLYMVYEVLGSPVGFDFWVERGVDHWLAGQTVPAGDPPALLRVNAPVVLLPEDGETIEVPVTIRLVRSTSEGCELVTQTEDDLTLPPPGPGRYRVEVDITPTHLIPFFGEDSPLLHSYPWIVSNPIQIE